MQVSKNRVARKVSAEQGGGMYRDQCKTKLQDLWNMLIKKKSAFPSKAELIQHKKFKTLQDLIDKLISKNSNRYYDEED